MMVPAMANPKMTSARCRPRRDPACCRPSAGASCGLGRRGALVRTLLREGHLHRRAGADRAHQLERSAVQLDEGARQGQAEPGAAVLAAEGALDLDEGFEHAMHLVRRYADAVVLDDEVETAIRR